MRAVRGFGDALNRNDREAARQFLADDVLIVDQSGNDIQGADEYLTAYFAYAKAAGNPKIVLDSVDPNREEVLVRGHLAGGSEEVSAPTMWRVIFDGPLIAHVEITRTDNSMTVASFAAQNRAETA